MTIRTAVFEMVRANCLLMSCLLICACGGGGGNSSQAGSETSDNELNGVVVDGYLVGVKVCLDLNTNWVCDPTEPTAITSSGGKYKLNVSPLKYWDTYQSLVIAEVSPDAYDEDAGKTLREQGISGYTLGSQGGPKPIISPMNTLGIANYLHHGLKDLSELNSLEMAASANGLSKTGEDYFDPNAKLTVSERELAKSTGKILARALADTQSKLINEFPDIYSKGGPGLGSRAASLLTQALKDTEAVNQTESMADKLRRINQQVATINLHSDSEKLINTQSFLLNASQALSILDKGLYDPNLLGSLPRSLIQYKSSGDGGSVNISSFEYRTDSWNKDETFQTQGSAGNHAFFYTYEQGTSFTNTIEHKISIPSPIWVIDGNTIKEKFSGDPNAPVREIQVIAKQVSGLPFTALPGLNGFIGNFSAKDTVYQVRHKTLHSEYVFDEVATFFKSLTQFITSPRTCQAGVCWTITKNSNGNAPGNEGVIQFTTTSSAGNLNLGEGTFIQDYIANTNILRILSVPIAVQNRSAFWSLKQGRYPIFADIDEVLWVGKYSNNGSIWTSEWLLSLDELNTALSTVPLNKFAN